MTKHKSLIRHYYDTMCRTLMVCTACLTVNACSDDPFNRYESHGTDKLDFKLSAPDRWTECSSRAGKSPDNVIIKKLDSQTHCGEQLYLITEIRDTDSNPQPSKSISRGTPVTSSEDFYSSFGVTAISYNGEWTDENNWMPGRIYNLGITETSQGSNSWKYPDEEILWSQIDSSRVRFFAYAPHVDSDALTGSTASLTHSPADNTGTPLLTYTVANDVESQIDLMTATADYDTSTGGSVDFSFSHSLTAVTINAGKGIFAGNISKVTLSGIYATGTTKIGSKEWTVDESSATDFTIEKEIPLDPAEGSHLTENETPLTDGNLTFLMIPQELNENAALKVTFTDGVSKEEHELTAELNGTWTAGTSIKYTISTTGIYVEEPHMEIVELPDSVPVSGFIPSFKFKSFFETYDETNGKTVHSFNPVIEYSCDGGTTWVEAEWNKLSETEDNTIEAELQLKPREVFSQMRANFTLTESGQGSKAAPCSLVDGETANCYMIHDHGYYTFPTVYGNAIKNNADNPSAYTYQGNPTEQIRETYVLENYVGHDDKPISGPYISDVDNAVLIWQDSPNLVSEIHLSETKDSVLFRVPEGAINQGNALIAVRNAANEILWSWHIWVTPYSYDSRISTTSKGYDGKTYEFTQYNLGFCDRHEADDEKVDFKIRLKLTLNDGTEEIIYSDVKVPQIPIEASLAGDNTYYQWGRKDPMLGGIWNTTTLAIAASLSDKQKTQFNMNNKRYYYDDERYKIDRDETQKTIGDAISNPNVFFMHDNPSGNRYTFDDYWKRHWHNGSRVGNKATIMNYWSSTLDAPSARGVLTYPNGEFPTKTIYDPCPAGFCVPPPNAFSGMATQNGGSSTFAKNPHITKRYDGANCIGWDIELPNGTLFFPATGLRDQGVNAVHPPTSWNWMGENGITYPAHADLTFLATSGFYYGEKQEEIDKGNQYGKESSTLITYFDNRPTSSSAQVNINSSTNNAYGFTIRPIVDQR